ncbi:MAG: ABC transporter permease [Bacteroidales bacterium]|nr:ABC transporter permease [Bacteroidales bacterium]
MNLKKLGIIIQREYLNKVKKKSFLLTTFGVPILFAGMYAVMLFVMLKAEGDSKRIAVIDNSGIVMEKLENTKLITFTQLSETDPEAVKNRLGEYDADVLLYISPLDSATKSVTATTYADKPMGMETAEAIEHRINDAVEAYRIDSYDIPGLEQIMEDVHSNVHLTSYTVDEEGKETISQSEVYMIVSMVLAMALYMFIALFSGMVMSSVIEEKTSRVVEVLVSSVKSTELMFGKIIGVALVALTQFLLWIVLTGVIIGILGGIVGMDKITGTLSQNQVETMPGMTSMNDAMGNALSMEQLQALTDTTAVAEGPTGMEAVLGTLGSLNYTQLIVSFLLFFLFGYLLYASLFAAIGSAVENEADTQQLQIPVTVPLLLGFFIAFYAFRAPESSIVWWGSMIPFTSPIVMLARLPFGVPMWELILSIGLLILTFFVCAWASAKIYKVGILMYGKKSTFKDLWKWLKQK